MAKVPIKQAQFNKAMFRALKAVRARAPIKTGNLRLNATNYVRLGRLEAKIKIDGIIAPYAVFTNEKWVSPKWGGKQNPNEGWVNDAFEQAIQIIAETLGGELRK